jgi:hypothetical protein
MGSPLDSRFPQCSDPPEDALISHEPCQKEPP